MTNFYRPRGAWVMGHGPGSATTCNVNPVTLQLNYLHIFLEYLEATTGVPAVT